MKESHVRNSKSKSEKVLPTDRNVLKRKRIPRGKIDSVSPHRRIHLSQEDYRSIELNVGIY